MKAALKEMAQVEIVLTEAGLHLSAPGRDHQAPDDMASRDFAQMPEAFAQAYLQQRLRNFLHSTFCSTVPSSLEITKQPLTNDRLGGGVHVGLLEQFRQCNQGKGYFDSGWQVVHQAADGTLAVEKSGIVIYVEPRHLPTDLQSELLLSQRTSLISIKLPGYRFESGVYIAIGNSGPPPADDAIELYFSAAMAAVPLIIKEITTALNGDTQCPYVLQVPYSPEGCQGPEAIVLRIEAQALPLVLPLIQQISNQATAFKSQDTPPLLRSEVPVFAQPLWPGISMASVIESSATNWFGSSADLSRCELAALALAQCWYQHSNNNNPENNPPSVTEKKRAIAHQFTQAGLCTREPDRLKSHQHLFHQAMPRATPS